ncbi:Hypothetical protein PAU_00557 [Photorhabdus asymbiotica]|uniref:Uncharacterized protein n=1 Tax=Photorhabdus asymbiotica subsp. asymbiotica (strain ATCC 43949 / 3105-77) TaxID=553480 RepID=C7BJY3_PHOAA|nr:Hypothetical protein PAU_00557 [Photorhabdus asymbiotica]
MDLGSVKMQKRVFLSEHCPNLLLWQRMTNKIGSE